MAALIPLDPAPIVQRPPLDLLATDAMRTDEGLVATVQAMNGTVKAARLVRLADPGDRHAFAAALAATTAVPTPDIEGALLELLAAAEGALRRQTARGPRVAAASQGPSVEWPVLEEIPAAPVVAALPAALLPDPYRPWLTDVAGRACLPLEFVAVPAITATGALIGRSCCIRPWLFDDYAVVPNLWGGIIGRPSTMKTFAIDEGTAPLDRLAAAASRAHSDARAEQEARLERLEAEIAAITDGMKQRAKAERGAKPAKGAAEGSVTFETLESELVAKKQQLAEATVTARRYVTQDATVEKLGMLLRENPRGLLIQRDELAGWLHTLDKPGREGDREFYLEAWNGTGRFTVDRVSRGTIEIEALTLSIVGGIQPGKLQAYINDATEGGYGADGLLQRLQLLVWPDDPGPWKKPDRWPNREARNHAYAIFERLDDLSGLLGDALQREDDELPYLRFAPDAQALADAWRGLLEERLRSAALRPTPAFESHLGKYRSLMPSLALVFHLVNVAAGGAPGPVSLPAARLAAAWCDFLETHACRVYATELRPGVEAAHLLAAKITQGAVQDGVTVRDLYAKHHWQGLSTAAAMSAALDVLTSVNWVRVERVEPAEQGGRPSERLRLHPDLLEVSRG